MTQSQIVAVGKVMGGVGTKAFKGTTSPLSMAMNKYGKNLHSI